MKVQGEAKTQEILWAPVQGDSSHKSGRVPWPVHLAAWVGYAMAGHGAQSAERIAERGGFSYREIQCCLAGCYNRCGPGHNTEHPPVPEWEPIGRLGR